MQLPFKKSRMKCLFSLLAAVNLSNFAFAQEEKLSYQSDGKANEN
jgi:hypothetical protein